MLDSVFVRSNVFGLGGSACHDRYIHDRYIHDRYIHDRYIHDRYIHVLLNGPPPQAPGATALWVAAAQVKHVLRVFIRVFIYVYI